MPRTFSCDKCGKSTQNPLNWRVFGPIGQQAGAMGDALPIDPLYFCESCSIEIVEQAKLIELTSAMDDY